MQGKTLLEALHRVLNGPTLFPFNICCTLSLGRHKGQGNGENIKT